MILEENGRFGNNFIFFCILIIDFLCGAITGVMLERLLK